MYHGVLETFIDEIKKPRTASCSSRKLVT